MTSQPGTPKQQTEQDWVRSLPTDIIMNTVLDGLITIDARGVIKSFNRAAEGIFQYTSQEVIGKNVKFLMPEPYQSGHDSYLANYLTTGDRKIIGIGREVQAQRKDGSVFPMELGVNEMNVGGVRFFVGTIRDISGRKQAEQGLIAETNRLQAVLQTVVDGIITIDQSGLIHSFNPAAERIFGYSPDEVIGKNVNILMPEPYHSHHDGYLSHHLNTGEKKVIGVGREVAAKRKDGSVFPIELGVNAMAVEGATMFVGTIRDISERVEAQVKIQSFVDQLQRSNQELDEFAYIASHDLKEPLRGLSNNATFLQEDYEDQLDQGGIKRLNRIKMLCSRLEQLVDDLLYYSRLGRQDLAIQTTDLGAVIDDIRLMMETNLHLANAVIIVPRPLPSIICDKPRITEVFRNLITNAIKYNDKPSKVIEVGVITDNTSPTYYVKDNGIGIEARFYSDIFRIFKRLNLEDDKVKGTGVGLTFVQKIIQRHGGKIWLESELGVGTTFYFHLGEGS